MIALMTLIYIVCNLGAAILLGCMLQSTFVRSSMRFRIAVSLLGAACLGRMFFGLTGEAELEGLQGFVEVAQAICLTVFLLLVRLRQRAAGLDRHPRDSRSHGFIPSC